MSDEVRRSVTVPAGVADAFRIYTELPAEWLPPGHTFIKEPSAIAFEPWAGGRFFERGADGTEVTRGTIMTWEPPSRLAVTWRIGPGWQPVYDDARASVIVVSFEPAGHSATEVVFRYTCLERHGEMESALRAAIANPGPVDTLSRYAEVVARHSGS